MVDRKLKHARAFYLLNARKRSVHLASPSNSRVSLNLPIIQIINGRIKVWDYSDLFIDSISILLLNFLLIKIARKFKFRVSSLILFFSFFFFFFSEVIFKWSGFKGGRKINLEITLFTERERGRSVKCGIRRGKIFISKRLNDAHFVIILRAS